MSKPKIKRHGRKAMSVSRLQQLLKQHLYDTGAVVAYVDPPFTAEEHAEARFKANSIATQLNQEGMGLSPESEASAARVAALTEVTLYRMRVQGVINYLQSQLNAQKVLSTAKKIDEHAANVPNPFLAAESNREVDIQ